MSAATGTQQWPEKVVFTGTPELVALKYGTGKRFPSQKPGLPDSVLYSLTDGRNMWVPLEVAASIDQLNLAIGEAFLINKLRNNRWSVTRAPGHMRPDPAVVENNRLEKNGADLRDGTPAPQPLTSASQMSQTPQHSAPMNGNGETPAVILSRCYIQAVDIALATVQYAESKGLRITPDFDSIRTMAATLCITETQRQR